MKTILSKKLLPLLIVTLLLSPLAYLPRPAYALTNTIYDDALAHGWVNWSWATVDLASTAQVHAGTYSTAVTAGAWQGFYLHNPEVDNAGVTHLRFFYHGGLSGGQRLNVFFDLDVNGVTQTGPLVALPAAPAGAWQEVLVPLSQLNPNNWPLTGITWQDATGTSQPTVYLDDISLYSAEDPNGPTFGELSLNPRSVPADGATTVVVHSQVNDPQGTADIASVILDATSLGRGMITLLDDGRSNDGQAGDGLFGTVLSVPIGTQAGERRLHVIATDQAGHQATGLLGVLTLLATPGGAIPASLPQRIGWGTNAWSETPGEDWQQNSGVPWDYVYQYITWGWETWGDNFTYRWVHQAWDKGYIPVVTVYMMLGVPNACGETGACYAQKLQDPNTVQAYLSSLQTAVQEAQGSQPVIFHLEPDFYGTMQQFSNDPNRPAGVQPDNPASYPVALNQSGYANNLAGFGRYMVDMIHATAPNALVAPHASMWATNGDPLTATPAEATTMAQRTATFISNMGGAQADLLVMEWSDRDAGSGLRPWWDDTDHILPRPTRALLWENNLSVTGQKRLLLWQVPVGNMAQNNTPNHYQDNKAAYAFNHPRDLVDAGVIGVLLGGGSAEMTQVWADGGYVAAQGKIAYDPPATPTGLAGSSPDGIKIVLRWDENSETDMWGYRLEYRSIPEGFSQSMFVGRRSAYNLYPPFPGLWEIRLIAVDAMGAESGVAGPLLVTTDMHASFIYLPMVRK